MGKKTVEKTTVYLSAPYCSECQWFGQIIMPMWLIDSKRECCPTCGNKDILPRIGKYHYRETTKIHWFFGKSITKEYLSFELKADVGDGIKTGIKNVQNSENDSLVNVMPTA